MRVMRIMRIVRVAVGAPMSNNHPNGKSSPESFPTAASKPTGYHMTCHGVARQGEDGRTLLIRQVRHKRHAAAPRTPPLPSSCPALPCGNSAPKFGITAEVCYTLRAALMRIMRIMRVMRVSVGAPMSKITQR